MSRYLDAICNSLVFDRSDFLFNAGSFFNAFSMAFILLTISDESRWRPKYRRLARICLVLLCLAYLGFYLVRIAQYSRTVCLLEPIEPAVISISWLWGHGAAMYHSSGSAERYSFAYGPIMYICDWIFLYALGPSIHAAKQSGVWLALMSVALIFWTLKRATSAFLASVGTTYCLLVFLLRGFSNTSFGLRAEAHLVFWVSVGLFSEGLGIPVLAALGCGLATGMLVSIKISAPLYALPIFGLLYQRHGVRPVLGAILIAGFVALCPFFAFKGISLSNYLTWLKLNPQVGLSRFYFKMVVMEGLFVILPVVATLGCLYLADRRRCLAFLKTNQSFFLALALGFLLHIIPASKAGGGPHHLMPFIPTLALVIAITLNQLVADGEPLRWGSRCLRSAAIAFAIMALATTVPRQMSIMEYERVSEARARTILAEIKALEQRFAGKSLAMGYGNNDSYPDTNLKAVLVLDGNPYLIDSGATMDMEVTGLEIPGATHDAIRNGVIDVWLIPAGDEPFVLHNSYPPHIPVFQPSFRKAFFDHYTICYRTEHFDVWCFMDKRHSG
jgi:hypothetical protein